MIPIFTAFLTISSSLADCDTFREDNNRKQAAA